MKAVVDAQALSKELRKVSLVIKKNTVLPILAFIKLSFEKSKLTIMATDLDTTMVLTMNCECKSPFSVVVEFSVLSDLCNRIFEPITIDASDKENILITSNTAKFKLAKNNNEESFPGIHDEEFYLTFDAEADFFWSLHNANICKSDDQFKVNMNTACVHVKKNILTIVGTDAYVAFKTDLKIKTGKEVQLLVNEQFVNLVKGFADAKVSIGEKFIKAEYGETTVISRLQDAKYCNYEAIMSSDVSFNFNTNRAALISTLSLAGVAANPSVHLCALHFNGGDIKITSQDIDYGREGEAKLKANHSVEIKSIGVNGHQMLKLLNLFDSEEVEMAFRGETQTIFMRPVGEPNTLCLLQPLMINSNNI